MSPRAPRHQEVPPAWLVWAALWVVYIVWGSTYLAIRVYVRTLPPLLTAGARFLVAGTIMWLWLLVRHGWAHVRVSKKEVGASALVATAMLFGGNGLVTLAEQRGAPSSLAALIIASVPLWVILLRRLRSERIAGGTFLGVAFGFAGVGLLVLPGSRPAGADALAIGLLLAASAFWASGSFFSKSLPLPRDPFVSTATQMLTGGVVLTIAGVIAGESPATARFETSSVVAFAYLVVAGSLLAFTAYVWLLQNAPISKVATYAYVNPVVAVFLGWLILSEQISVMSLVGSAAIVSSVAFIVRKEATAGADEEGAAIESELIREGIPAGTD
jgi:drug/metabolite transporter (DMT)-like permease